MTDVVLYERLASIALTYSYHLSKIKYQGVFIRRPDEVSAKIILGTQSVKGLGRRYFSVIGIDIGAFEEQWCDFLEKNGISANVDDQAPLLIHSSNLSGVGTSSFAIGEQNATLEPALIAWFSSVCEFSQTVPSDIALFKLSMARKCLSGLPLWKWTGHPLR